MRMASAASGLRSRSAAVRARRSAALRRSASGRPADSRRSRIARASGSSPATAERPRIETRRSSAPSSAATAVAVSAMATFVGLVPLAGGTSRVRSEHVRRGPHRRRGDPAIDPDDRRPPRDGARRRHEHRRRKDGAQRLRSPHAAVVHAREATGEPDDDRAAARRPGDRLRVQNGERADLGSQLGRLRVRGRHGGLDDVVERVGESDRARGTHLDARRRTGRLPAGHDHARGQCGDDDRTSHVARRRSRCRRAAQSRKAPSTTSGSELSIITGSSPSR